MVEEYKTSLIAEAVTGKIDLREYEFSNIKEEEVDSLLDEELRLAADDEEECIKEESEL